MLRRILCWLGLHYWFGNVLRRWCLYCPARQVQTTNGWRDHDYPPGADPHLDPTPTIDLHGRRTTVGHEELWASITRDLNGE